MDSEFIIVDIDGKEYSVDEYEFKDKAFEILVRKEALKEELKGGHPLIVNFLKKFGFKWEPMSDLGHMRFEPYANLIFELCKTYAFECTRRLGVPIFPVSGTNMFSLEHKAVKKHAELFGERLYEFKVGKNRFVLRFAACHQQFAIVKDWIISYKHLPFGVYELADSYRLEQSGELLLCFRVRKLHMPDLHIFCKDIEQAEEYSLKVHKLILDEIAKLGERYVILYNVVRSFYEKHKDFIVQLNKICNAPSLIKFVPEGVYYWVINAEYHIIDELNRPREIATFQIDVGNAERFDITYMDKDGSIKHPTIIHTAIIGSIERFIYTIFDKAAKASRKGEKPSLPLWLTPVQVRLMPLKSEFLKHCEEIAEKLSANNIRVDIDDRDMKLGAKIRDAEKMWVPYIVSIGSREVESGKLSVRIRVSGKVQEMTVEQLIAEIRDKCKGYPFKDLPGPRLLSKWPKMVS